MRMEAPEYLDLDEIDFSDDSVVSVTQRPLSVVEEQGEAVYIICLLSLRSTL